MKRLWAGVIQTRGGAGVKHRGVLISPLTSSSIYSSSQHNSPSFFFSFFFFSTRPPCLLIPQINPFMNGTQRLGGKGERNCESEGWWNPKALRRTVLQYLGGVEWAPLLLSGLKLKTLLLPFTVLRHRGWSLFPISVSFLVEGAPALCVRGCVCVCVCVCEVETQRQRLRVFCLHASVSIKSSPRADAVHIGDRSRASSHYPPPLADGDLGAFFKDCLYITKKLRH